MPRIQAHNAIFRTGGVRDWLEMSMAGTPGSVLVLQRSTNFVEWVNILTNTVPLNGCLAFVDPSLPSRRLRLFSTVLATSWILRKRSAAGAADSPGARGVGGACCAGDGH